VTIWRPGDWEDWINDLLRARYPLGAYQQIPHQHGGDFGIEGFSTDGCAYQCYAPTEPLSVKDRYEAHRNKMTSDIKKFITNAEELLEIFGPLRIRRWLLVVPRHDSAKLVVHAEKKAALVRAANLPYVHPNDFRVGVVTEEDFARERALLASASAVQIHIPAPEIEATEEHLLDVGGPRFLRHLNEKTSRIRQLSSASIQQLRQSIISYYVQGQVVLDRMRRDYPEVFEVITQEKAARARQLELESLVTTDDPRERIKYELRTMQHTIHERFPNISSETQTSLAMEALADWLLTCPLSFPEAA
jgi:hypothetical protein